MIRLPVLPLRDWVLFPGTPGSFIVGRARSLAAIRAAMDGDKRIMLVGQRRGEVYNPSLGELYSVGTIGLIDQGLTLPDGNIKVLLRGVARAKILDVEMQGEFLRAHVEVLESKGDPEDPDVVTLLRSIRVSVEQLVKMDRVMPPELLKVVKEDGDVQKLADLLVMAVKLNVDERQELLEETDLKVRLERVFKALENELEFLQVEQKLKRRVKRERDNTERENWLNDQVRAMRKELDEPEEEPNEQDELARRIAEKPMTEAARERSERELKRLKRMNPMSAEATVVRNYLEWMIGLPWKSEAPEPVEGDPRAVLDENHYGLKTVKDRIVEYLAVSKLTENAPGPVLCLAGPPGVGKTSIARAIAEAMGRPFARIALGGVRDEAEIRGHRRTYIGAMPGRLVQAMKRAGHTHPVLLLDEVDKLSTDFRGDPASALLEVLDPEQNKAFNDHYLDLDYDLSGVMFICTANALQRIPGPLLDRLEVIDVTGYTEEEKVHISRDYLLPRVLSKTGLSDAQLSMTDEALREVVRGYTRESGVRSLERQLAKVARGVAVKVVEDDEPVAVSVGPEGLKEWLGPAKFDLRTIEEDDQVGLVKGLSVSGVGGAILDIEVAVVPGKGVLKTTGKPGEMLKESAQAGFTYVRGRAEQFGLSKTLHEEVDIHIHYPGLPGGVEGPSAGIGMVTALVSALTGIVVRRDTAMTGEVSLRGRVLRIGGLKEKILAAHRGGITRVIIPKSNVRDLHELPDPVREAVEVFPVEHMDEVLRLALRVSPWESAPVDGENC